MRPTETASPATSGLFLKNWRPICALLLLALPSGCRSYHLGSLMHPQVRKVAVGKFTNEAKQPRLGVLFRQKLIAALAADGSVLVTSPDKADAILQGRVEHLTFAPAARGKTRDEANRDKDREAYQTIIYRATTGVAFSLSVPGRSRPLIPETHVTGQADFTPLPDMSNARRFGVEQALSDAARRTAQAVLEAW